jgi:hypothetical protein
VFKCLGKAVVTICYSMHTSHAGSSGVVLQHRIGYCIVDGERGVVAV